MQATVTGPTRRCRSGRYGGVMRLGLNLGYMVGSDDPAGAAHPDPARRGPRFRRGLGGGGVRLGQSDRAGLVGRTDQSDRRRGRGDADPGPQPGDDGDDGREPRPAQRRPVPARAWGSRDRRCRRAGTASGSTSRWPAPGSTSTSSRQRSPARPSRTTAPTTDCRCPDGPGKPLKLTIAPTRPDIPIYLAAVGPKNLELTGEIADGWLAVFYAPGFADDLLGRIRAGRSRAGKTMDGFDVVPTVPLVVGDDPVACADPIRAYAALYVGGMGSREQNFYHALAVRMGFEDAAERGAGPLPGSAPARGDGRRAVRVHRRHVPAGPGGADRRAARVSWRRRASPPARWRRTVGRSRRSAQR